MGTINFPLANSNNLNSATAIALGNVLFPVNFGATGINRLVTDAAVTISGNGFSSATAALQPVGAPGLLVGANIAFILPPGAYASLFITTIATITSATAGTLTATPPTNASGCQCVIWVDDTVALQACADALLPGQVMDGGNLSYFTSGFVPPNNVSIQNIQLYVYPNVPSLWVNYPSVMQLKGSGIFLDGTVTPAENVSFRNVRVNGLRTFQKDWYQDSGGGRACVTLIGTQANTSIQNISFDHDCVFSYGFSDGLTVACYIGTPPTNDLLSSADGIFFDGKLLYNRRSGSQIQGALNVKLGPNHDISCNGVNITGCLLPRTWLPAGGTPETPVLEGDMGEQYAGGINPGAASPTLINWDGSTCVITQGDVIYWPLQVGNPYINLTHNPQLAAPIGFRLDNGQWFITTCLGVSNSGTAWSSGTGYVAGNLAEYSGVLYRAILNGTNHQPDISPTYWAVCAIITLGTNPSSNATNQNWQMGGVYGLGVLFEPFNIGNSLRHVRITGGRAIGNASAGYSEDENFRNSFGNSIFASNYIPGGPMSLTGNTFDSGQNLPNAWGYEPSYNAFRAGVSNVLGAQPVFDGIEITGCTFAGTVQCIEMDHFKLVGGKCDLKNLPYTGTVPAWSGSRDYSLSTEVVLYAGLIWQAAETATGNVAQVPQFGSTYWTFSLAPALFIQCRYHDCIGVETIPPYISPYSQYQFQVEFGLLTSVAVNLSGGVYTATCTFPHPHLLQPGQRVQFHSNGSDLVAGYDNLDLSVATVPTPTTLTVDVTSVPGVTTTGSPFTGASIVFIAQDYNQGPFNPLSNQITLPNGGGLFTSFGQAGVQLLQRWLQQIFFEGNQGTVFSLLSGNSPLPVDIAFLNWVGLAIGGLFSPLGTLHVRGPNNSESGPTATVVTVEETAVQGSNYPQRWITSGAATPYAAISPGSGRFLGPGIGLIASPFSYLLWFSGPPTGSPLAFPGQPAGTPPTGSVGIDYAGGTIWVFQAGVWSELVGLPGGNAVISGYLQVGHNSGGSGTPGDIASRNSATTGAYYFGDSSGDYLSFDGTIFNLAGGALRLVGNRLYFGSGTGLYLEFDGTNFNLVGAPLKLPTAPLDKGQGGTGLTATGADGNVLTAASGLWISAPPGGLPNVGPGAGTYTVGNRITPVTGNLGTITLDNQGRVTAVQQAT